MTGAIKYPKSVIIWYKMIRSHRKLITFFVLFSGVCLGISCVYEVLSMIPSIHEIDRIDYIYLAISMLISLIPRYIGISAMLGITLTIVVMLLNIKKLNTHIRNEKKHGFLKNPKKLDQAIIGRPRLH